MSEKLINLTVVGVDGPRRVDAVRMEAFPESFKIHLPDNSSLVFAKSNVESIWENLDNGQRVARYNAGGSVKIHAPDFPSQG
jgi:hypothetical protein